ncbi:SufB/SufD family protein [Collinsella intestinalis]|uniref:SufD family Fe-S cluster assembly protein n=1 Tax=Collinsella intestinalis TaxID=147207 RepID=A0A414FXZ7_9ACTN|nr:SufD family Fe-S cluster assembly protein [Collinsella intestinalis]RHD56473.1 SufD family Fe-S cluster assembly protein [Collinsella intestinalis]
MKMPGMTIRHASAMPASTWSWLKMNDVTIQIPDDLERNCQVEIEAGDTLDNTTSFEGSVAALQERIDSARTDTPADERAMITAATGADRGAEELDIPALSTYEHRAVLSEIACDIANDFETGVGADMRAYLNFLAGGTAVLATEEGEEAEATIRVTTHEGEASGASIDIVAAPNSTFSIALSLDSAADAPAFMGSTTRVFAGAGARVDITVYLTASDAVTCVEDSGFVLDEGARVNVRHVVLGGGFTATGLAADLRGDRSRIDVDTSYLASGTQQRDFNYIIRHRGRKTISNMDANGVLTGMSKKCLRGTIDLIHGAKGAEGNERETVLLASKGVDNKTVPNILCDEDDVAGNHGATIGHVRPEQLFYAACRGLSQEQTEALFLSAKLEDAALQAPNDAVRANVVRLGNQIIPHFEEEIA